MKFISASTKLTKRHKYKLNKNAFQIYLLKIFSSVKSVALYLIFLRLVYSTSKVSTNVLFHGRDPNFSLVERPRFNC